jgi:hypothetical protein
MKVEKRNNWGTLEYYWGKIKIDSRYNGKITLVDGLECEYESIPHRELVSDWGHSYGVNSRKLIAKVPFNDQLLDVDLDKLDITWITTTTQSTQQ